MPLKKKPKKKKEQEVKEELKKINPNKWQEGTFEAEEENTFIKMYNYPPYLQEQHSTFMKNVVDVLKIKPEHQVLDLGCGVGKNAAYLCDLGINVHGIDITSACLENTLYTIGDKFYFTEDSAWTMPHDSPFDFVICTFLLENLPFTKIQTVLFKIAKVMKSGGFITISTELEPHGPAHINKQLHRTVQNGRYWADILGKYFTISWDDSYFPGTFIAYIHTRKENKTHAWPTGY